jgi:hypothetical protein
MVAVCSEAGLEVGGLVDLDVFDGGRIDAVVGSVSARSRAVEVVEVVEVGVL